MPAWLILFPAFITAFAGTALVLLLTRRAADAQATTVAAGAEASPVQSMPLLLRDEVLSTITFWARLLGRFDPPGPVRAYDETFHYIGYGKVQDHRWPNGEYRFPNPYRSKWNQWISTLHEGLEMS